jgi:integrase
MARKRRKRANGSIQQQGQGWRIRWREKGRRRSATFPDKETAEKVLKRIIGDLAAGRGGLEVEKPAAPPLAKLAEDWLSRRQATHRAARDDRNRWAKHLKPLFGHLRPDEVDQAMIRRLVEAKLAEGLVSTTCKHLVRLVSTFFSDLVEQGHAKANPAKDLPKATRRLIRDAHDPTTTVFIEDQADIAKVYGELPQPFATIFITGALTGMRPGEIIALEWTDIDLAARRMLVQRQVRHGRLGPTKSGKPRIVPFGAELATILAEWKLASGGDGLLFKPLTAWRQKSRFIGDKKVRAVLTDAFRACGLPAGLTWYGASRHTWASQLVKGGGSLAVAQQVLGHSSPLVTQRYAHLKPDHFQADDLLKLTVDLSRQGGDVIRLDDHRNGARGTAAGLDDNQVSSGESASS